MIRGLRSRFRQSRTQFEKLQREGRISVGAGTYAGDPGVFAYAGDSTRLICGAYTSIARDVRFVLGGNHRIDTIATYPLRRRFRLPGLGNDEQPWSKGDIIIGSDVWIGVGATILSGVEVGNGAVIAAGSVVTSDVRSYAVVVGVPAREIRRRFPDDVCSGLEEIAWWSWPKSKIVANIDWLTSENVKGFVERFGDV